MDAASFAEGLLAFWMRDQPTDFWWEGGEELDQELTRRYGDYLAAAAAVLEHQKGCARDTPDGERSELQRRLLEAEEHAAAAAVPAASLVGPRMAQLKELEARAPAIAHHRRRPMDLTAERRVIEQLLVPFAAEEGAEEWPETPAWVVKDGEPVEAARLVQTRQQLALVVLLDQFSRNIHRGSPQAFAYDRFAGPLAGMLLARRAHLQLAPFERFFLTMPLEHSENPEQQELGVVATTALMEHVQQRDGFEGPTVKYFEEVTAARSGRAELIKQFGRYPPRNEALGRENTEAEAAYLAERQQALEAAEDDGKDASSFIHVPTAKQ